MSVIKDIDRGFKKFMREVSQMQDAYVKVGFPSTLGKHEGTDATITQIALKMEYGDPNNKFYGRKAPIPARPFFSNAYEKNKDKIMARIRQYANLIFTGALSAARSMRLLGAEFKGDIQKEIKEGHFEPLSPVTIAGKGSSKPLIDTGQMRQSVQYEIGGVKLPKEKG